MRDAEGELCVWDYELYLLFYHEFVGVYGGQGEGGEGCSEGDAY